MKVFVGKRKTVFLGVALVLALICSVCAAGGTGAYAALYGKPTKKLPIYSVETSEKKIAVTFDAAWGVDYTDAILECLAEYQIPATFFLVEFWTKKYSSYVAKIHQAGHAIGTHGKTHAYMSKQSKGEQVSELSSSSKAISDITGTPVTLFRAPYGDYSDALISTAEGLGLYTLQWDVDSLDWKDLSAGEIAKRVVSKVQNGSIILMHNNGLHTAESLPLIFEALLSKGYQFVRADHLIYKENYEMDVTGRQHSLA